MVYRDWIKKKLSFRNIINITGLRLNYNTVSFLIITKQLQTKITKVKKVRDFYYTK